VMGAPSVLAALSFAVGAIILGRAPPPDHSAYLSLKTYGPTGALQNGAHAVGNVLSFMGMLASGVLGVMAISALVVALFAGGALPGRPRAEGPGDLGANPRWAVVGGGAAQRRRRPDLPDPGRRDHGWSRHRGAALRALGAAVEVRGPGG
jgi:hypothetical protein